jgi:predicted RNA polymerase sigma factor
LWQSGRQIEARYQWRRAIALEDDTTKQKEIEDKIDHGVIQDAAGPGPAI